MFDSFAPLGPCIVNKNLIKIGEAGDINLSLQTLVNSEIRQSSNSGDMLFNVASLVSFTSQGTTLYPGDIIFTGTPEGTGMGMKPHRWLQNNDIVKCVIEDLGYIENKIIFE
ncbi:uncharacterized protein PRCAT00001420001 [Priceomyces carsonii]|uniref:uncharacterized protein n=1 Tax=Priceomyces carsonii TaxID=28549 RepID=UPI002ED936A6|nr:unnamed protein product [Priceomyces carsonii]